MTKKRIVPRPNNTPCLGAWRKKKEGDPAVVIWSRPEIWPDHTRGPSKVVMWSCTESLWTGWCDSPHDHMAYPLDASNIRTLKLLLDAVALSLGWSLGEDEET